MVAVRRAQARKWRLVDEGGDIHSPNMFLTPVSIRGPLTGRQATTNQHPNLTLSRFRRATLIAFHIHLGELGLPRGLFLESWLEWA
jgi:hypothetical protein